MASSSDEGGTIDVDKLNQTIVYALQRYPQAKSVQEVPSLMTSSEKQGIALLSKHYGDRLKVIALMPDKSYSSLGGHVHIIDGSTPVKPEVSFQDEMFGTTVMVPITQYLPKNPGSTYQKYVKNVLCEKVQKILHKHCSVEEFATLSEHYDAEVEHRPWKPHWHSGSVGIFYLPVGEYGRMYYLGFRCCTIGRALTTELVNLVRSCGMTAEMMCTDPRFLWARQLSLRNVGRMIYLIFRGLKWDLSCAVKDTISFVRPNHICPRYFPVHDTATFPNSHCMFNTFSLVALDTKKKINAVKFFIGCSDGEQSTAALVHCGDEDTIHEIHGIDVTHHSHRISNDVYNALPLFSSELQVAENIGNPVRGQTSGKYRREKRPYKHSPSQLRLRKQGPSYHYIPGKYHPYTSRSYLKDYYSRYRSFPQGFVVPPGIERQAYITWLTTGYWPSGYAAPPNWGATYNYSAPPPPIVSPVAEYPPVPSD